MPLADSWGVDIVKTFEDGQLKRKAVESTTLYPENMKYNQKQEQLSTAKISK